MPGSLWEMPSSPTPPPAPETDFLDLSVPSPTYTQKQVGQVPLGQAVALRLPGWGSLLPRACGAGQEMTAWGLWDSGCGHPWAVTVTLGSRW